MQRMPNLQVPTRQPIVPLRRVALDERAKDLSIVRGQFTVQSGERIPIPSPARTKLWESTVRDGQTIVHRPGVRFTPYGSSFQRKTLEFLRDRVHHNIPYLYYMATLGHDLHVSTWGNLYARHYHIGWANPFNPEMREAPLDNEFVAIQSTHFVDHDCDLDECPKSIFGSFERYLNAVRSQWGFVEDLGWLSGNKVTDVFVNVEVGALTDAAGTGEAAEFNDFNEHEVGTNSAAENNNQTALSTSSDIALVAGTQVDDGGDPPTYTTVATITADAGETWEEHGVFSTTTDSLMDRSLTGGQAVTSSDQVQYTYTLTVNPEA
jgi:hypothetical protein